jgi:glyoxylase-like metal-dependent hydrolase (beta-lactamase superfamily II)
VADADRYAARFGAERIIHRAELASQPDAEWIMDGDQPTELSPGFLAIPTPGHTRGHMVLLHGNRFLFTGDHLAWDRDDQRLTAFRDYCWHSWPTQAKSMARLLDFEFEWVLPGHGQRVHLPADAMARELAELIDRMKVAG